VGNEARMDNSLMLLLTQINANCKMGGGAGRHRHGWINNIEVDLILHLIQGRGQRVAFVEEGNKSSGTAEGRQTAK